MRGSGRPDGKLEDSLRKIVRRTLWDRLHGGYELPAATERTVSQLDQAAVWPYMGHVAHNLFDDLNLMTGGFLHEKQQQRGR